MLFMNGTNNVNPISASTGPNVVDFNQWNHLVYTFTRQSNNVTLFTFYKNGVLQPIVKNNFTSNLNANDTSGIQIIGYCILDVGGSKYGLFDISQYRMYNKTLDTTEVNSLFQATRARYSI
jgi:hypothetical protein